MIPAASLRALLTGAIDYAGLFPPATLPLEESLRNYAEYARSPDAWMLGAFVLPVEQFAAAEQHLHFFDEEHPLRVSALGRRSASIDDFTDALAGHAGAIAEWQQQGGRILIAQLEMPLPQQFDDKLFIAIRSLIDPLKLQAFWEAPADEAERAIAALAAHNATRPTEPLGFKLRTGGVTADAFPDTEKVARALVAGAKSRVPIKFTAGLHHPVRTFREEVKAEMHGFLNVFGAGVLASENRWHEDETRRVLEEENPRCFVFSDRSMTWRDDEIGTHRITAARRMITSFGSCSFNEPREDLRALNLL
jgi:hypothetical protein